MKVRQAKKQAKRFLGGGKEFPVEINWFPIMNGDGVYKVEYCLPIKVWQEVYRLAFRRGWKGCHWDSPTLLGFMDKDGFLCPPDGGWGEKKLPIAAKALAQIWYVEDAGE